ncbi:MAG: 60S ribosomal protein L13 [Peltula sp. TS41687]|nr:MAG: 60S ribosomal protein L13 [Peltula sp. TS41687]
MAIKHNQQIPNNHFHKDWQRRVRVHFDQPGRKKRRREARLQKAAKLAPRPVDKLRPIVRCPTIKYNRRVRAGRGFTFDELKEAGIPRKFARTIGIAVDHRRRNVSMESLTKNVERLKSYRARLILFPRVNGKPKQGDASSEQIEATKSGEGLLHQIRVGIAQETGHSEVQKSEMGEGEKEAYRRLREVRSEARLVGVREKRAKAKADEAQSAKK